jgi:hypothetical protein
MAEATRDRVLTILAVLFGILALSNFLKPFQFGGEQTGFVFLGRRLSGPANTIVGPLFGMYLLAYAAGIWRMRRSALVMGYGYAAYVVLNLVLFNVRNPAPPGMGYVLFGIVYSAVAIGVSSGAAYLLTQRKTALT